MFPNADIPVVQLSVDADLTAEEIYHLGEKLAPLRNEGYLMFASGNVVHNLRQVEWGNESGSNMTLPSTMMWSGASKAVMIRR